MREGLVLGGGVGWGCVCFQNLNPWVRSGDFLFLEVVFSDPLMFS